jgi:hypothetical protein
VTKVETDITKKIELSFDPIQYDTTTLEAVIPVRLRNTSDETLYGPVQVEVKGLVDPNMIRQKEEEFQYILSRLFDNVPGRTR